MRKLVEQEDLINWWLEKYHNTNLKQVEKDHPEWMDNPKAHTREFYSTHPVTQEQHDEWEKWAKEYTKKVTGVKGKLFDRGWCWVYLDCSPQIIRKIKMVCSECGSDAVFRDAWAKWEADRQEWILAEVFDDAYCNECNGECSLKEVEV